MQLYPKAVDMLSRSISIWLLSLGCLGYILC